MSRLISLLKATISISWLKTLISLVAIGTIVVRIIFPDLKIDAITFGLIVVAILPWLSELIESAKLPGGWEVKFRDLREAEAKVTGGSSTSGNIQAEAHKPSFIAIAEQDSNLALVGLRIEIEKRLREYARQHSIDDRRPLSHLMRELSQRETISSNTLGGLQELIYAGNSAAHGAHVPDGVADWAVAVGPKILAALDEQLANEESSDSTSG